MKLLENRILIEGHDFAIFLNNRSDFIGFRVIMVMYPLDLLFTSPASVPNPKITIVDSIAKKGYRKLAGLLRRSDLRVSVKLAPNTFPDTTIHSMVGKIIDR